MKKIEIRRIVKMEEIFEVSFADDNEEEEVGEGNQEKDGNGKNISTFEIIQTSEFFNQL